MNLKFRICKKSCHIVSPCDLRGDCKPYPIMLILGTFFSETNKHRTMKLYIATFPLPMHKLRFFVNIGENLAPFMRINID